MKSAKSLVLAVALALPLSFTSVGAIAADAAHDGHEVSIDALELNAGQKWETDAPLRQGMEKIHGATTKTLEAAHGGKLSVAQYDAYAEDVNTQFTYIVQNCKLEPQADAQLHILLGSIMSGIEVARGKEAGHDRELGIVKIAQSMNAYGKHFDHAGWKTIDVAH
jgi:hypothetical protein